MVCQTSMETTVCLKVYFPPRPICDLGTQYVALSRAMFLVLLLKSWAQPVEIQSVLKVGFTLGKDVLMVNGLYLYTIIFLSSPQTT